MQIIGIRTGSSWRVPSDWYVQKQRYSPGVDPTTGGPVAVVHDWTDVHADGYLVDCDLNSNTFRQVIQASTSAHRAHIARTAALLPKPDGATPDGE